MSARLSFVTLALAVSLTGVASMAQNIVIHTKDGRAHIFGLASVDRITFSEESLDSGLIAYYPFNGNADDKSGNENNGTVYGAALTQDRNGDANSAYSFDGQSHYIEVAEAASLDIGAGEDFAVVIWVRTEMEPATFISKYASTGSLGGFLVNLDAEGKAYFDGRDANGYRYTRPGTTTVNDNTWHCLVGMRHGTVWSIWVDGAMENSIDAGDNTEMATDIQMVIGCHIDGDEISRYFIGDLDDIRLYNRALSEDEIGNLSH